MIVGCLTRLQYRLMLAVVITAAPAAVQAQESVHARAAVTGTVFDSLLTNAPLAGADVVIEGTDQTATTDRRGSFRIDGVAAGRVVLRFYHPSLDSLGFGAAPKAVTVGDSGTVAVALATPSTATLHARLCPLPQPQTTGVLLGRVRDVDAHTPLPNADVTVRWGEWTLGAGALVRKERVVTAGTDTTGAYMLCGVPTDVAVVARATASSQLTGLVEIDFAQRLFATRDFGVSLRDTAGSGTVLTRLDSLVAGGDSVSASGTASITGAVRSFAGSPVANAQVALFGFR